MLRVPNFHFRQLMTTCFRYIQKYQYHRKVHNCENSPRCPGDLFYLKMLQQTKWIKRLQYQVKNEIYWTIATSGEKYICNWFFVHSHQFTFEMESARMLKIQTGVFVSIWSDTKDRLINVVSFSRCHSFQFSMFAWCRDIITVTRGFRWSNYKDPWHSLN